MKKYSILKKLIWALTIFWMCTIFYFSNQPASISRAESGSLLAKLQLIDEAEIYKEVDSGRTFWLQVYIRKFAHFSIFFILGILLTLSLIDIKSKGLYTYLKALLLGIIYAASDEIHQIFIPGRGPSVHDVILDSAGVIAAVVLCAAIVEFCKTKKYKYIYYLL